MHWPELLLFQKAGGPPLSSVGDLVMQLGGLVHFCRRPTKNIYLQQEILSFFNYFDA